MDVKKGRAAAISPLEREEPPTIIRRKMAQRVAGYKRALADWMEVNTDPGDDQAVLAAMLEIVVGRYVDLLGIDDTREFLETAVSRAGAPGTGGLHG